jgi:Arc/MetJ-type ribon-helix-helix transcriptional regulator
MSARKERMTVTVDRALVQAANEAVASGRASSLSTWVNAALAERAAKEQRLRAMAEAVAAYEARFGEISTAELIAQQRQDRRTSIAVRDLRKKATRSRRRKAA